MPPVPPRYPPDRSVFINCPFDPAYQPLADAAAFTVAACGFVPRSAQEIDASGQARFEKIIDLIRTCGFGIHDLSRTDLSSPGRLPRMNMPLELGLFLGAQRFGSPVQRRKRALVLDSDRTRYRDFISDIAGHDIKPHGNDAVRLMSAVRDLLAAATGDVMPGPAALRRMADAFEAQLAAICRRSHLRPDEATFPERRGILLTWMTSLPATRPAP